MRITRRQFGLSLALPLVRPAWAGSAHWNEPASVKKIYLAVPQPTWPYPALDVAQEMAGVEAQMAAVERANPGQVRFSEPALVRTPEAAQQAAADLGGADAVLIVDLTSGTAPLLRPFGDIDVPVLLFSRPYSGWSYIDVTGWAQAGKKADLIVTSEPGDLQPYLRMFRTIGHLKRSRVLVVNAGRRDGAAQAFTQQFGTAIEFPDYKELAGIYDGVPLEEAQKAAGEFTRGALRIVEPSEAEIAASLRFYLAMLKLLEKTQANAITIDCLGGFRRGDLPAYPCVAWSKLNDAGLYGVCEADLRSTMTQLLLTPFTNKPGFVTDPVFDVSRNEIIHAHCVSATAMQGLGGPACPYAIRSHMEDNRGVSLQVMVPAGETVTVGKFLDPARFAVSTGEVVGNVEDQRGCRTKFRTKVADARKMLDHYTGGLHRVVFYGDYVKSIERMGRLMGFQVIREG